LEHPREKTLGPIQWAPGTVVYLKEITEIMDVVKSGRQHTLSPAMELTCAEISALSAGWTRRVTFALISYEEALRATLRIDSWMILAQNAALGAQTLICEDRPVLPKDPGPHAEKGGEVLEGMYAQG
jgi:hypothetical protein